MSNSAAGAQKWEEIAADIVLLSIDGGPNTGRPEYRSDRLKLEKASAPINRISTSVPGPRPSAMSRADVGAQGRVMRGRLHADINIAGLNGQGGTEVPVILAVAQYDPGCTIGQNWRSELKAAGIDSQGG
jgi:hypothetical protein